MSAEDKTQPRDEWLQYQRELTDETGLAIAIVDSDGLTSISESNNNSICSVLSRTDEFSSECAKYCGRVHSQSKKTRKPFKFKCHAGLECIAVPVNIEGRREAAAIVGRAFTKAEDYRIATERAISGEWSNFAPSAVFENILLTGSQSVELLAKKVAGMDDDVKARLAGILEPAPAPSKKPLNRFVSEPPVKQADEASGKETEAPKSSGEKGPSVLDASERPVFRLPQINKFGKEAASAEPLEKQPLRQVEVRKDELSDAAFVRGERTIEELAEQASWRSLFGDILDLDYSEACKLILNFIREHYRIQSLAWLENHSNRLVTTFAMGKLRSQKIQISVAMDDPRMRRLFRDESSIELRERVAEDSVGSPESIRLFPLVVGNRIRSALVIGDGSNNEKVVESIARFCKTVASELEILRLREELSRRSWIDIAFKKFNESLKMIDTDDFWIRLMQNTAEIMRAERGSLLIHDEKSGELVVKAAIGRRADLLNTGVDNIGQRVALGVWERGEALVVRSIVHSSIKPAPAEWNYKTGSFISYPLVIGDRKIGVLNIADKVDGGAYGDEEVLLLNTVVPQIAVAADRANLKNKAGEYEQLSVTDPLTGLLNRRYLEERVDEEIKRSARHGYPMSFMMIDVDDFKSYNDQFLHPEGDKALKIVGQCLRETLRGADVAARYGGEEFSILLPQTTLEEAKTIAERIRGNIESAEMPHRQVTVSIGIATLAGVVDDVEKLIECADKALFKAKREGKNQVIVFKGNNSGLPVTVH